jgi:hypothetical protein
MTRAFHGDRPRLAASHTARPGARGRATPRRRRGGAVWAWAGLVGVLACSPGTEPRPDPMDPSDAELAEPPGPRDVPPPDGGRAEEPPTPGSVAGSEEDGGVEVVRPGVDADAPAADAGASPDAGAPASSCAALPLCDGFETATAGAATLGAWSVVAPNCQGTGRVVLDQTQAHRGSRSVRVEGGAGYCNHVFITPATSLAAIGPVLFGRFFLRLGSELGDGHVTLLAMKDAADGKDLRLGGQSKILMWNRESDDATLPALSPVGIAQSRVLPRAHWLCIELALDRDAGTLRTWIDGAPVTGLAVDAVATPEVDEPWLRRTWRPRVQDLRVGWESYGDQTNTLWFDDVAFGGARIGCDL